MAEVMAITGPTRKHMPDILRLLDRYLAPAPRIRPRPRSTAVLALHRLRSIPWSPLPNTQVIRSG